MDLKRRFESLTAGEREVMQLIADGQSNTVVAVDLQLSERRWKLTEPTS